MTDEVEIPMTVDQIDNTRAQFVAAHGADAWTCFARAGKLVVPADIADVVQSIDPDDSTLLLNTRLIAYAADKRWQKETGGITVAGVSVATDDRSKQMIIGARLAANSDPNWTTQWVGADGAIYPINAAAIIAISDTVQAHVNACFTTYALVKADIDSGTITTTAEIDAAFAA